MDDVRVRTNVGAVLTFVSAVLIMALTFSEFFDYMKVREEHSLEVDRSRQYRLEMHINVTFPRVPCYCTCRCRRAGARLTSSAFARGGRHLW